ncbi:MAG: hypothetical protein ACQERL_11715, partial [Bacillota bacterium]
DKNYYNYSDINYSELYDFLLDEENDLDSYNSEDDFLRLYSDTDITLEAAKPFESDLGNENLTTVLVVKGNVNVNDFRSIKNLIIIAEGKVSLSLPSALPKDSYDSFFIYSDFTSEDETERAVEFLNMPNFTFEGQIFAQDDIFFGPMPGGSNTIEIFLKNMDLPGEFADFNNYLENLRNEFGLVNWKEI